MLKFVLLAILLGTGNSQEDDIESIIQDIFGPSGNNLPEDFYTDFFIPPVASGKNECEHIEGRAEGCFQCYPCRDPNIMDYRRKGVPIQTLALNNASCISTEICCVAVVDLGTRGQETCGQRGESVGWREAPRAVLDGEYPWHASVYKKTATPQLLCSASYIDEKHQALVTSASCVQAFKAGSLRVKFDLSSKVDRMFEIDSIVVHEKFNKAKHENDIAVIKLKTPQEIPKWVTPICLPTRAAVHATPCLTLANNNYILHAVIPKKHVCSKGTAGGVPSPFPESQLCAVAPRDDYAPRNGAGLFCEKETDKVPVSTLHGIALLQQDSSVSTYTNVSHFIDWLNSQLK